MKILLVSVVLIFMSYVLELAVDFSLVYSVRFQIWQESFYS